MIIDFTINLVAGIALVLLGYSFEKTRHRIQLSSLRMLWQPFLKGDKVVVVFSTRLGPHPRSTPRISFNEMLAYVEISQVLKYFKLALKPVSSEIPLEEIKSNNVVLLGGPVANKISAEIWQQISSHLPFNVDIKKQILSISDRQYIPTEDASGQLIKDYGLVIRMKNPLNYDKSMIIALGCHGFSTYGALRMLTNKESAKQLLAAAKNKNFVALIELHLRNKTIISSHVIECYAPLMSEDRLLGPVIN